MRLTQYDAEYTQQTIGNADDETVNVHLSDGSVWRLMEREPGVLEIMISEGARGHLSSTMTITPSVSNVVRLRVDTSGDDAREITRLRKRVRQLAERVQVPHAEVAEAPAPSEDGERPSESESADAPAESKAAAILAALMADKEFVEATPHAMRGITFMEACNRLDAAGVTYSPGSTYWKAAAGPSGEGQ